MATSKNTLKNWFKTGMFPTQSQFWAWLDSYHHKDENIPVAKIEGLNELLTPVNEHFNDPNAHTELFDKVSEINTIIVDSGFLKQDNVFKALANSRWNIKAQEFTNSADIEIPIPLCAAGMVRTDRVVLNMNNQFVLVQGVEVSDNPVPTSKPVNTLEYTFIPVNDSEVGEPDTPTIGNLFNKKDYDKVYTFNASGADVEIPFNVSGFGTIELTGSLTSVKGFSLIDLADNPTLAEWPHKGKPIYLINRSGHNIELKHNNLTAIVPFNFDSNSSIIIPNNGKILLKVMTNNIIDFFKSWGDDPAKLDKVSTVDVDKVYIKNADGTQGMKPTSEFGVGGPERLLIKVKYLTGIRLYNSNTWRSYSQSFGEDVLLENGTGSEPDSSFFIQATSEVIPDGYIVDEVQVYVSNKLNGSNVGNLEVYIVRCEVDDKYLGNDSFNKLVICHEVLAQPASAQNQKYITNLTVNSNSLPTLSKSYLQIAIRDTFTDIRYNITFNIIVKKL